MTDSLRTLLGRLFELWAELNTPSAMSIRPSSLSGPISLKHARQAMSHDDWLAKGYNKPLVKGFKIQLNVNIADLKTELSTFVWSWSVYCAELLGLPSNWAKPNPGFLLIRAEDIALLEIAADFRNEIIEYIGALEHALGYSTIGVACPCGKGRMEKDSSGTFMCSTCTTSFTAFEIDKEMRDRVTLREAASLLSVKEGTLRQRVSRNNIQSVSSEKPYLYRLVDLKTIKS